MVDGINCLPVRRMCRYVRDHIVSDSFLCRHHPSRWCKQVLKNRPVSSSGLIQNLAAARRSSSSLLLFRHRRFSFRPIDLQGLLRSRQHVSKHAIGFSCAKTDECFNKVWSAAIYRRLPDREATFVLFRRELSKPKSGSAA
jgi:hypothetical protein